MSKKTALVLGGGGFIGGHLCKRLRNEGYWVRAVDIKQEHEFFALEDICDEYISGDLRDPLLVAKIILGPEQLTVDDKSNTFDEVYQLAADMGGAGYIFTGENDANVMHNSATINLNVSYEASRAGVKKIFYSSSACIYPEHNQLDPDNPNCEESSAYPANPDSEYGWEKLFSERLFFSFYRNYGLNVRVARFHNIFGPFGTWTGGKEKAPAALCRKVAETVDGGSIEVWGDGLQTRSFLYIDDCLESVRRFMDQDKFFGSVNIGSEEMISINNLAKMIIRISGKKLQVKNIPGPLGVRGRNSDNRLFREKMGWEPLQPLETGIISTYDWISKQVASQQ